jgi:hypothetical protein
MNEAPDSLAARSFPVRFRAYLAERFPLGSYATLILLFLSAGHLSAQHLAGVDRLWITPRAGVGFVVVLLAFLVLRFLDEFKDYETDRQIHPERLVSRGVIRLRELGIAAVVSTILMLGASALLGWQALAWCGGILVMLLLLWREFFIPRLLGRSYAVFAAAHQLLHPALVGFCFASWIAPSGKALAVAGCYSLFAAFSFLAFDVGRKLVPPELEREGWETYSARYGMRPAAFGALALLTGAVLSACGMAYLLQLHVWVYPALAAGGLLGGWGFVAFLRTPDGRRADKLKGSASLTMLLGFLIVAADLVALHGVGFAANLRTLP